QREFQVLDVLFGQGGHRHVHAGQRDALVVGDRPALGHPADDVVAVDAHDDQADLAVVDQQAVAGLGIGGELLVGGGNTVVRALDVVDGDPDFLTGGPHRAVL